MSEDTKKPIHRQHKRRRKTKRHERSLIRDFSFEIVIGLVFLFGVFLLFEQMEIKSAVFHGIVGLFKTLSTSFSNLVGSILGLADIFETSDIVGTSLILVAFILFIYRVRQKSILRYHDLDECPDCSSDLIHIHRNMIQRVGGKLFRLKIRRYRCKKCDYEGLRIRSLRSR